MSYEWRERWRKRYKRHIGSKAWRLTKQRLLFERGARCERCGRVPPLNLHHKTYERFGYERDVDLELVCVDCHPVADKQRAQQSRVRRRRRWRTINAPAQLQLF
jgi:hypothetical protein